MRFLISAGSLRKGKIKRVSTSTGADAPEPMRTESRATLMGAGIGDEVAKRLAFSEAMTGGRLCQGFQGM